MFVLYTECTNNNASADTYSHATPNIFAKTKFSLNLESTLINLFLDWLLLIISAASLFLSMLLCICVAALRRRNTQVIRHRHTKTVIQSRAPTPPPAQPPGTPKNLNIIVHNKRDGTLTPDARSLASRRTKRSTRSGRSRH